MTGKNLETKNTSPMNQFIASSKHKKKDASYKDCTQTIEVKGIGYLPRDLLIEILSRLPAKDLCKLRCVSKSWNELLSRDIEIGRAHV